MKPMLLSQMKFVLCSLIAVAVVSCNEKEAARNKLEIEVNSWVIPAIDYSEDQVFYNRYQSIWQHREDSSLVSGFIVSEYPDESLLKRFGVFEGKKEGVSVAYFQDGRIKATEEFHKNRLNGEVKRWQLASGYNLVALLNYKNGKLHGEQKKWYDTGELHKVLNMANGKEEGMQQAFRKNGALYANYQALNGRTFGMKRSNLCFELDNEKVVYKK